MEQGYVVVNVNYALAPNYKYPTPLIQFDDAIQFIKHNKDRFPIDLDQVVIGGDSAGAQLKVNMLLCKQIVHYEVKWDLNSVLHHHK